MINDVDGIEPTEITCPYSVNSVVVAAVQAWPSDF
jgi:hypothetical protein